MAAVRALWQPVEGPAGLSYDERLIWALGHPDGDRAITAARTLGARRAHAALPALRRLVDSADPYLAADSVRSVAIEGLRQAHAWLEQLADSDSFMVCDTARVLVRELQPGGHEPRAGERWYPGT